MIILCCVYLSTGILVNICQPSSASSILSGAVPILIKAIEMDHYQLLQQMVEEIRKKQQAAAQAHIDEQKQK